MSTLKAVADAICKADGHNPDYVTWVDYKEHAKAALQALIDRAPTSPEAFAWNRRLNGMIYGPATPPQSEGAA